MPIFPKSLRRGLACIWMVALCLSGHAQAGKDLPAAPAHPVPSAPAPLEAEPAATPAESSSPAQSASQSAPLNAPALAPQPQTGAPPTPSQPAAPHRASFWHRHHSAILTAVVCTIVLGGALAGGFHD